MRGIYWFINFICYLIYCAMRLVKLNFIKKRGSREDVQAYVYKVASSWGKNTVNSLGIKLNIIGKENLPKGNCLFVGNHQSYFDIPIMLGFLNKPMGFIAKKEMEKAPIIKTWMREMKSIFMDRDNVREAIKSINEGVQYLKDGYSLVIFPEGTRSKGNHMNEFKKGSLKLGTKSGVPIVPISISGSYKAFEGNGNWPKPAEVNITISKPIMPNELSKEEESNIAEIVQKIVEQNKI